MKNYLVLVVLLLLAVVGTGTLVLAADTSDAEFYGIITISNNSTANTSVATVFTANTTAWIANSIMNSSANNTAIISASGADIAYMPGYAGDPWCLFVPSIGENTYLTNTLYTGGTVNMSPKLAVFGSGLIDDAADLEPSDNFSIAYSGYFDFTSANTTKVIKPDALSITTTSNGSINMGIGPGAYHVSTINATQGVHAGGYVRYGERFDSFPAVTIESVSFYLLRQGSPTGNATINVRAVTGDAVIGALGSIDVSTIPTTATRYTFNNSVAIPSSQNIRVMLEYASGDGTNRPKMARANSDNSSSGQLTHMLAPATYGEEAAQDITGSLFTVTVNATGYSSGEHDVLVWADSTNYHISVDGSETDNTSVGSGVPDKGTGWKVNGEPYFDEFSISVGGNEKTNIKWEYSDTLSDLSGNGNDATLTPREESSDADISATLSSFLPVSEAKAPAYTLSDAPTFFTTTPGVSGNFTYGGLSVTYPGHEVITEIAAAGAVPDQLPQTIFATFVIIVLSLGVSYMMKSGGVNSLFIKMCIIAGIMCIFVALGIFDAWQVYFFVLLALSCNWLSRQREAY